MRIALVHLSDFHIQDRKCLHEKIDKLIKSFNLINDIDKFIIVFTGDLADRGQINEYKSSRWVIGKLIVGLKNISKTSVDLVMVPGNHDLSTLMGRNFDDIQTFYTENTIDNMVQDELKRFDNFFAVSHANAHPMCDIVDSRIFQYGDCKLQFNLINSALFSTEKPNDKELHYFPKEKLIKLQRGDVDYCITLMHHSFEWFHWNYKSLLENKVIGNSEFIFWGHDHINESKNMSINESKNAWISCGGSMNFTELDYIDSFKVIILDTANRKFDAISFTWDSTKMLYIHKNLQSNIDIKQKTEKLCPTEEFIIDVKKDEYSGAKNFLDYFVFPKLLGSSNNEFGKKLVIENKKDFLNFLEENNRINIIGQSNSGKTTLLKYLFCILTDKTSLFYSVEPGTKAKSKNFIKRLFEDEYGDDPVDFERFQQLEKNKRVIIIDGWDRLRNSIEKDKILNELSKCFGYIVFSLDRHNQDLYESIKTGLSTEEAFKDLVIQPFVAEKRHNLVEKICLKYNVEEEKIKKINELIDKLVHNNIKIFSFNPSFIIKYTDYFIANSVFDYTRGEATFSQVFEFEIQKSIISFAGQSELSDMLVAIEEIAGYMFINKRDVLTVENVNEIITHYNDEYGMDLKCQRVLDISINSKILTLAEDMSILFANKNYLAYFIAKYLIKVSQSETADNSGIIEVIKHICFGINSDIILFLSYLTDSIKMIYSVAEMEGELLTEWAELDFNKAFFILEENMKKIGAPTKDDKKFVEQEKEKYEEENAGYNLVAKGVFEYNEADINKHNFKLLRAIRYMEILCKALPVFNNKLKLPQKEKLIEYIYSYPLKIAQGIIQPIGEHLEEFQDGLYDYVMKEKKMKKSGVPYTKQDIVDLINDISRASVLAYYDHFANLCTNSKTILILDKKEIQDINRAILRLMIIENSGQGEYFIKEAEKLVNQTKDLQLKNLILLEVRKHILCSPALSFSKRQEIVDKFFGKHARKEFLISAHKKI